MRAPTTAPADLSQLEAAFERTEVLRQETAEAERAAYERWLDALGAYEVARDESTTAWTAWATAVGPS
jgi:hypothetical protein